MMYSKIIGTGRYLPKKVLTNDDLKQYVDTSDDWIRERTGIQQRHVADHTETVSFMGFKAAQQAIDMAQISPDTIDLIICATTSAENNYPSSACLIQNKLGLHHCPAFDIGAACSGFVYALVIANDFILTGRYHNVLIVGSDELFKHCDPSDRSTLVLFGDGAGAAILSSSTTAGILSSKIYADGSKGDLLKTSIPQRSKSHMLNIKPLESDYLHMKGNEVFKHAVSHMAESALTVLQKAKLTINELDWLIPHNANLRILYAVAKKLHLDKEKVVITLNKHGNTSAASIPIALDTAYREGKIKENQYVLLNAFGAGFTWGSVLIQF